MQIILDQNPSLSLSEQALVLPFSTPEEMLADLQNAVSEDFPVLSGIAYEVKTVDDSLKDFLSPAFYLTPPMDTGTPNVIYINPAASYQGLELFTTLAHEGFPGHLYQTVSFAGNNPSDIRYLVTSSGYVEGWATYVESYGYEYAASLMNDPDSAKNAVRLAWLNRSMNLCIYSLLDVGIHYHGWTPAQAARFLKLFGIRDAAVTAEIYRYITETPANYLKYYVGYLNFLDLKEEQQSLLGENFDLKSFHQKILEIGPVQFPVLRKYMNEKL